MVYFPPRPHPTDPQEKLADALGAVTEGRHRINQAPMKPRELRRTLVIWACVLLPAVVWVSIEAHKIELRRQREVRATLAMAGFENVELRRKLGVECRRWRRPGDGKIRGYAWRAGEVEGTICSKMRHRPGANMGIRITRPRPYPTTSMEK